MLNKIIETEKYWQIKVGSFSFPEKGATLATIWKAKPNKLRLQRNILTGSGGWRKDVDISFSIKNGSFNVFDVKSKKNSNLISWNDKAQKKWDKKSFQNFIKIFNFFLKKNGRVGVKTSLAFDDYKKGFGEIKELAKERDAVLKLRQDVWPIERRFIQKELPSGAAMIGEWKNQFFWSKLKDIILAETYPAVKKLEKYKELVYHLPDLMKKPSLSFEKLVFSVTGTNGRKTRRIFAESSSYKISTCRLLKGLLPLEDLQECLANSTFNFSRSEYRGYRAFAKKLKPTILKKLISEERCFLFRDSFSQWEKLDKIDIPKEFKNMKEIHDYLSIEYKKKSSLPRQIPYKDDVLEIDGAEIGDLTLELPKTTHDLITYGTKMNNCVASYGDSAVARKTLIIGVYLKGMLKYNIEIFAGLVRQFYGSCNSSADPKHKKLVTEFLLENNIIKAIDFEKYFGNFTMNQPIEREYAAVL